MPRGLDQAIWNRYCLGQRLKANVCTQFMGWLPYRHISYSRGGFKQLLIQLLQVFLAQIQNSQTKQTISCYVYFKEEFKAGHSQRIRIHSLKLNLDVFIISISNPICPKGLISREGFKQLLIQLLQVFLAKIQNTQTKQTLLCSVYFKEQFKAGLSLRIRIHSLKLNLDVFIISVSNPICPKWLISQCRNKVSYK